ncbi:MAG: hypothetical protein JWO35_717 [Candidatus Saccharibacteria bacterium]|nr:hypothetical protein [Candidatus Saccharibacteria bacterium]
MSELKKPQLALTVPRNPIGLTLDLGMLWEEMLHERGFGVSLLLNPLNGSASVGKTEKILREVDGLVIPSYNTRNIAYDADVLTRIQFAQRYALPVFVQVPTEETQMPDMSSIGAFSREVLMDAEIIPIGSHIEKIRERLNSEKGEQ